MAYCKRCQRSFPHFRALQQHKEYSNSHWFCYDCGLDFPSCDSLHDHYLQSPNHYYCTFCRNLYDSASELETHQRDAHNYCSACCRAFMNQNNLQQHLNSKLHKPSDIACPGRGCNRTFISVAALALHFESGTCPSGMTRKQLDDVVVRADRNRIITNPDRLITGPGGGYEAPSTTEWATNRSWNAEARAFECFVCHALFRTLPGLNQHLQSPVHKEKIYRCPKSDCRIEFKTLSALCQHVEAGSCGVRVFRQVQDVMDRLTKGFNMLTF